VGIECDVKSFVYEKVVACPLADDAEVVDERLLNSDFGIELVLSNTRSLILVAGGLADSGNPLRLKVRGDMDSTCVVHSETEQSV
jgi:hypothetical protein